MTKGERLAAIQKIAERDAVWPTTTLAVADRLRSLRFIEMDRRAGDPGKSIALVVSDPESDGRARTVYLGWIQDDRTAELLVKVLNDGLETARAEAIGVIESAAEASAQEIFDRVAALAKGGQS